MLSKAFILVSPNLPIGSFSYSQALETCVEEKLITCSEDFEKWLAANLKHSLQTCDLPLLKRLYEAKDKDTFKSLVDEVIALRTTKELREEEINKGKAFARLLSSLEQKIDKEYLEIAKKSYLAVFSLFGKLKGLSLETILQSYCYAYIEAQTIAAIKLVPLGQTIAWQIIDKYTSKIDSTVQESLKVEDDYIGSGLFNLSLLSVKHENLYSRLFRS